MILVAIEEISCWKYIFLVLYGTRIVSIDCLKQHRHRIL